MGSHPARAGSLGSFSEFPHHITLQSWVNRESCSASCYVHVMPRGPYYVESKGACIYCGAIDVALSDEHVVPYSRTVELDDAYLGGEAPAGGKRGRGHLRPGTVVRSDGLHCFRGVQAAGCEHQPHVTGGGKGSCEPPA